MMPTRSHDESFRRKLFWLVALRVVTVTVLFTSSVLAQIRAAGSPAAQPFFLLIGVTYGLTVVYVLTRRYTEQHRWLVDLQLTLDVAIVSVVVFRTGGIASYFSSLYVLPILAASIIQFRRGGLLIGMLSALGYGTLVLAQYESVFTGFANPAFEPLALLPTNGALYSVGLSAFGFLSVAALSGYLSEGLREAGVRLERASTQIADLRAFNEHVIESLTSGLATTDPEGRVRTFNRTAEAITGHTASSVIGMSVFDVLQLPPDLREWLREDYVGDRRFDLSFTTVHDQRIEVGLSAGPLNIPHGRGGFLFTFQDVTKIKKLEREALLQQRLAAVGELAAGIAHEIRNPLASMSGSIQILRQDLSLTEEQAQLMSIVLRESERLNETIKSFLAYARPQRFSTVRLDVRHVITDTALLLRNSAECREVHSIDIDVPDQEVWFEADEGQVRQIVWNLATNGLRAMPTGGRLRLRASQLEDDVLIRVEDEGTGMSDQELDGLFQPFRGSFARGTGLGLAIVHRIVTEYGGTIQVRSEPSRGTRIDVLLPRLLVARARTTAAATTRH